MATFWSVLHHATPATYRRPERIPSLWRGQQTVTFDRQAALAGLLVLRHHVATGLAHRLDHHVQGHEVKAVTVQCERAADTAVDEAMALRSMHGTWTSPPTGSQVRPRWCSTAISAAFSTWRGVPPRAAQSAPDAMAQAVPTSAWQPPRPRRSTRWP